VVDWSTENKGQIPIPLGEAVEARNRQFWRLRNSFTVLDDNILKLDGFKVDSVRCLSEKVLVLGGMNGFRDWYLEAKKIAGILDVKIMPSSRDRLGDKLKREFWASLLGRSSEMDENDVEIWTAWEQLLDLLGVEIPAGSARDDLLPILAKMRKEVLALPYNIGNFCGGRHFCVTQSGKFGLLPPGTKKEDEICRLVGVYPPFVLRRGAEHGCTWRTV
jgi:hypothetical protein